MASDKPMPEADRSALTAAREAAHARREATGVLVWPHGGASDDLADEGARCLTSADHLSPAEAARLVIDLRPRPAALLPTETR